MSRYSNLSKRNKISLWCAAIWGVLLIIIGPVSYTVFLQVRDDRIKEGKIISSATDEDYEDWTINFEADDVPLYTDYFLMEVTNAEEVMATFGATAPIFQRVGPYRYQNQDTRFNVTWAAADGTTVDNSEIEYLSREEKVWVGDGSTRSESDEMWLYNVAYASVAIGAGMQGGGTPGESTLVASMVNNFSKYMAGSYTTDILDLMKLFRVPQLLTAYWAQVTAEFPTEADACAYWRGESTWPIDATTAVPSGFYQTTATVTDAQCIALFDATDANSLTNEATFQTNWNPALETAVADYPVADLRTYVGVLMETEGIQSLRNDYAGGSTEQDAQLPFVLFGNPLGVFGASGVTSLYSLGLEALSTAWTTNFGVVTQPTQLEYIPSVDVLPVLTLTQSVTVLGNLAGEDGAVQYATLVGVLELGEETAQPILDANWGGIAFTTAGDLATQLGTNGAFMLTTLSQPFVKATVAEHLWTRVDPILSLLGTTNLDASLQTKLDLGELPYRKRTGTADLNELGRWIEYWGLTEIPDAEGGTYPVDGWDGVTFPPFLDTTELDVFVSQIRRNEKFVKIESSSIKDVPCDIFRLAQAALDVNALVGQNYRGVVNTAHQRTTGTPIAYTKPQFKDVDPAVAANTNLVGASDSVEFDPQICVNELLGATIDGRERILGNVLIAGGAGSPGQGLHTVTLPFWQATVDAATTPTLMPFLASERWATITDDLADDYTNLIERPAKALFGVAIAFPILGLILLFVAVWVWQHYGHEDNFLQSQHQHKQHHSRRRSSLSSTSGGYSTISDSESDNRQ